MLFFMLILCTVILMYNAINAGKIGELVCMLRLMKLDVPCEIVHIETTDVVASTPYGLVRVQVKSSQLKRHGSGIGYQFSLAYGGKKRPLTREHCDVVAFVALDRERVLFKPVECLKGQVTKRFLPHKFDRKDLETRSWDHCLDHLFL